MFWCLGPEASGVFAAQQNGTCCPAMEGKVLTAGLLGKIPQTDLVVVVHIAQSCPTLCNPIGCRALGFPVLHCLLEFAQTQVH